MGKDERGNERDEYGHYVNSEGVEIRASSDKNDRDHIDFYDKCPAENKEHGSIHINFNSEDGKGTIVDTMDGSKETTDVSCFLTTACMKYYLDSFDDNCYELTVLRWFRDNFISKADIEHYYKIAPIIIEAIDEEQKKNIVYDYIYDNVVDKCIELIENGEYVLAYNVYKENVLNLEKNFAKPYMESRLIKTIKNKYKENNF